MTCAAFPHKPKAPNEDVPDEFDPIPNPVEPDEGAPVMPSEPPALRAAVPSH